MLILRRMHRRCLVVASTSKRFSSSTAEALRKFQTKADQREPNSKRRSYVSKSKSWITKLEPTEKLKKEFDDANPVSRYPSDKAATFNEIRENFWKYYTETILSDLSVLDSPQLLGEETRNFLQDNIKKNFNSGNPLTLLTSYTEKHKIPPPDCYTFELPHHSIAKRYVAWAQIQGFGVFGTFEQSPQNAKHIAAAYVIDHLVKSGQFTTMPEDITEKEFEDANPTPANFLPDQAAKFVEKRKELWKLYTSDSLGHPRPFGEETGTFLKAEIEKGTNIFEILENYAIRHNISRPDYYIFKMPHYPVVRRKIAWVHFQDFEAFGTFERFHRNANLTAAAYAIDHLVKSGRLKNNPREESSKGTEQASSEVNTSSVEKSTSEATKTTTRSNVNLPRFLDQLVNPNARKPSASKSVAPVHLRRSIFDDVRLPPYSKIVNGQRQFGRTPTTKIDYNSDPSKRDLSFGSHAKELKIRSIALLESQLAGLKSELSELKLKSEIALVRSEIDEIKSQLPRNPHMAKVRERMDQAFEKLDTISSQIVKPSFTSTHMRKPQLQHTKKEANTVLEQFDTLTK